MSYVLKPITREKLIRNAKSKKRTNRIAFKEQRVDSRSFVTTESSTKSDISLFTGRVGQNIAVIDQIRKNKITELISALKSMALGVNQLIIAESSTMLKDKSWKAKLDKLQEDPEEMKSQVDIIWSLPILKLEQKEFDDSLTQFLWLGDVKRTKAPKVLLQTNLMLEMLVNKLVEMDKFKTIHMISKLQAQGEDVNVHLEQYSRVDYLGGKMMHLYFELLNKLVKSKGVSYKPVKEEIKEPGIHISGSFEDYLKGQVGWRITEEFVNYITCILSQQAEESQTNATLLKKKFKDEITNIVHEKDTVQEKLNTWQKKISELLWCEKIINELPEIVSKFKEMQQVIDNLKQAKADQIFNLSECDKKEELIEKLKHEINVLNTRADQSDKLVQELYADNKDLESKRSEDQAQLLQFEKQTNDLRNEVANAHFQSQKNKEADELKKLVEKLRTEQAGLCADLQKTQKELESISSKDIKQTSEIITLKSEIERYQKLTKSLMMSSANSCSQQDYDKLREEYNNEISKNMGLQADIEILNDNKKNTDILINMQKEEIVALKDTLREFTTFKYDDYDDTYEAVLKGEFDRMKVAYEARLAKMQSEMEQQRKEMFSKNVSQTKEIAALKTTTETLTRRLSKFY